MKQKEDENEKHFNNFDKTRGKQQQFAYSIVEAQVVPGTREFVSIMKNEWEGLRESHYELRTR